MKKAMAAAGIACSLLMYSCDMSGEKDVAQNETVEEAVNNQVQELGELMDAQGGKDGENAADVQAVEFEELKNFLSEDLVGFERSEVSGERVSFSGYSISQAEATYTRGDERIVVRVQDIGTLSGIAAKSMTAILSVELDREDDSGFQRNMVVAGHKAHVEFRANTNPPETDATVLAGTRFLIEVEGHLDPPTLEALIDELDTQRLIDLAGEE